MLTKFIYVINLIIGSYPFLFFAEIIALSLKLFLFYKLIPLGFKTSKNLKPWSFLLLVLLGSIVEDLAWLIRLVHILFIPSINLQTLGEYSIITFFTRFAWAFALLHYQSLALFIESLTENNFNLNLRIKSFLAISTTICLIFLYYAFYGLYISNNILNNYNELLLLKISPIYCLIILFKSLFIVLIKLKVNNIPKILRKQLNFLIVCLICPRMIADFMQVYPFLSDSHLTNYAVIGLSTILITCAAFYCVTKVMQLRFLNLKSHVQSNKKYNFINKFTEVLEQLSHTTTVQELVHISKSFFKEALNIPTGLTSLYVRKLDTNKLIDDHNVPEYSKTKIDLLESFIIKNPDIHDYFKQSKILIYDELDFSNFYVSTPALKNSLEFMNSINADVFIPIYKDNTIIAYIVVEKSNNNNQLYSNIERDEMVVFSSYLGNIINLLQNRNLENLIAQEKDLKEELYFKHQEINQYKESIKSFLTKNREQKIGVLFYKNRKFIFGNQDAKELIPININITQGHSLTRDLKKIVKDVEDFKSSQICYTKDLQGNKIILMGVPNLENNNTTILVYHPDISDTIRQQIAHLKDPSKWDYLLYLETTKSGQLINQLMPGSGEILLNFKISLLKLALSRNAILLEIPEEDLLPTIEIIHHISLRENLHILKLQAHDKSSDIAIKLFGINPIFEQNNNDKNSPLLHKLNNGTLYIQNIHFMDITTQDYLANFIKNGYFHIFKGDQKISSDVRVICSTNLNLKDLVQENKFSKKLYTELQNSLIMPSLFTLPESELNNLAQGYSEQAIQSNAFKNLLELTDKEKMNIINKKPVSLQEFKNKIQQILMEKSKKNNVQEEILFDPAYNITDPKLIEAARLGKYALRDPKMLVILWNKFKNQNKIATFLGVNRSSVHRRFREYKLNDSE